MNKLKPIISLLIESLTGIDFKQKVLTTPIMSIDVEKHGYGWIFT